MLDTDRTSLVMSDDGSTVAFAVSSNKSNTGGPDYDWPSPQLHVLDGQTGKVLWVFDLRSQGINSSSPGVSITRHGEFIAFSNQAVTYVLNRKDGSLRGPAVNKGVDAPCHICPMGVYIAWGFTEAHIARWNATIGSYVDRWVFPGKDENGTQWYVVGAVSSVNGGGSQADGCLASFGWIKAGGARQARVDVYSMLNGKKYWTWLSSEDVQVQTEPYLSMHMNFVAVGHWGSDDDTDPQTLLFNLASPTPLFSYVSPGSMFDVQVAVDDALIPTFLDGAEDYESAPTPPVHAIRSPDAPTNVYVTSGGKHVHASVMGNGGDAYGFLVTI